MGPAEPMATVSGIRAADMALRLKYAGIDAVIQPEVAKAVGGLISDMKSGEIAFVLPTYTAMLEVRSVLANYTEMAEVKQ